MRLQFLCPRNSANLTQPPVYANKPKAALLIRRKAMRGLRVYLTSRERCVQCVSFPLGPKPFGPNTRGTAAGGRAGGWRPLKINRPRRAQLFITLSLSRPLLPTGRRCATVHTGENQYTEPPHDRWLSQSNQSTSSSGEFCCIDGKSLLLQQLEGCLPN